MRLRWLVAALAVVGLTVGASACSSTNEGSAPDNEMAVEQAGSAQQAQQGEQAGEAEQGEEAAEAEAPADTGEEAAAEVEDPLGVVVIGPGEPVRIAAMFVLSGANESLGRDSRDGVEIAVDDMPEIKGHPVTLQVEDSECTPEGGQTAMTKVAADPTILGVIGPNCSSAVKAAAPIASQAGLIMFTPSATGPDLTAADRPEDYAGLLRTAVNDKLQGEVDAAFAYDELGVRKAATIHDGSTYAEQLQAIFADKFRELGGEITAQEAVSDGDVDMRPVLTRIAATAPEMIFYPIFTDEGGYITSQAGEVPGLEDVKLMGADGMFSADFVAAAGPAAEGVYISGPYVAGEAYDEFLAKVEAKYSRGTLSGYHAHAYDATMLVLKAIDQVAVEGADGSLTVGRQALRDALYSIEGYEGLTGTLTCNDTDSPGDCATGGALAIYQIGPDQVAGDWPPEPMYRP